MPPETEPPVPALQDKLARMDAVYQKFGRDGLKDYHLADVSLLLRSKEMELRDMPKRNVSEQQQAEVRQRELQVADLTGYLNSQLALIASPGLRTVRVFGGPSQQQGSPPRHYQKGGPEIDRG